MEAALDVLANSILKQKEALGALDANTKANFKAIREELKDTFKSLPKPKDGKDIDYAVVKTMLEAVIATHFSKETTKLDELQGTVNKAINETNLLDLIDSYMAINKDTYVGSKGLDGKDGVNGKDGKPGINGKDGKDGKSADIDLVALQNMITAEIGKVKQPEGKETISVVDIAIKDYSLTITYSNGKSKSIVMPKNESGGIAYTMPNSGVTKNVVAKMIADVGSTISTDLEITDFNKGVILRDPDNGRWRITIGIDGILTTSKIS